MGFGPDWEEVTSQRLRQLGFEAKMLGGRLNRTKIDWQMWLLGQRLFALWPVSYSLLSGQLCTFTC